MEACIKKIKKEAQMSDNESGKNIHTRENELGEKVVTLCGANNCCPTVTINKGGSHIIKDDFGGSVKLSQEQFNMLKEV